MNITEEKNPIVAVYCYFCNKQNHKMSECLKFKRYNEFKEFKELMENSKHEKPDLPEVLHSVHEEVSDREENHKIPRFKGVNVVKSSSLLFWIKMYSDSKYNHNTVA